MLDTEGSKQKHLGLSIVNLTSDSILTTGLKKKIVQVPKP